MAPGVRPPHQPTLEICCRITGPRLDLPACPCVQLSVTAGGQQRLETSFNHLHQPRSSPENAVNSTAVSEGQRWLGPAFLRLKVHEFVIDQLLGKKPEGFPGRRRAHTAPRGSCQVDSQSLPQESWAIPGTPCNFSSGGLKQGDFQFEASMGYHSQTSSPRT